jgi:hypothetical protein
VSKDPGLFTDSTGEGMAGATDVGLASQTQTSYNGDSACKDCGMRIDPVQSLMNQDTCPSCKRRKQSKLVKGGMA